MKLTLPVSKAPMASSLLNQQQQFDRQLFLESMSQQNGGASYLQTRLAFTNYPRLIPFIPHGIVSFVSTVALAFFITSFYGWPKMSKAQKEARNVIAEVLAGCICALFIRQEYAMESRVLDDEWPIVTGGNVAAVENRRVHYLKRFLKPLSSSSTSPSPTGNENIEEYNNDKILVHFFHGFGANALSWETTFQNMEKDQNNLGSSCIALAHCVPGFGYSPRFGQPTNTFYYRPLWQAKASLELMKKYSAHNLKHRRRILVGHSMGAISACCAAAVAVRNGENVTLILESGALRIDKVSNTNHDSNTSTNNSSFNYNDNASENGKTNILDSQSNVSSVIERVANWISSSRFDPTSLEDNALNKNKINFMGCVKKFIMQLVTIPLRVILKRILRTTHIWRNALKSMWSKQTSLLVGTDTILRYKLPAMARDFDLELLRFVRAQSHSSSPPSAPSASSTLNSHRKEDIAGAFPSGKIIDDQPSSNSSGVSHVDLLTELVDSGCKIILIHGDEDKVVPCSNSWDLKGEVERRMAVRGASTIAKARGSIDVKILPGLGHVPHEENPQLFTNLLMEYL